MPVHDVRCPNCNRLLFKIEGLAKVETVCKRCRTLVVWPDVRAIEVMKKPSWSSAGLSGSH
ncbi:MAG: Com family DNA-binding transcriptional regulator [bacterium]